MDHPFRSAARELAFFTSGAVDLEDTTIAEHTYAVGSLVTPEFLYLEPEKIREILRNRATRDAKSKRPILYLSTDAHAERLLDGESWKPQQRMANGIRIWCIDRRNGSTIHIGGEFLFGDCREVARCIQRLIDTGVLPHDGDYGDGVRSLLAIPTDGMPWFEDHLFPLLPWALMILDVYHMFDRLGSYARACFPDDAKAAKDVGRMLRRFILGKSKRGAGQRKRKGHKKRRGGRRPRPSKAQGSDAQARSTLKTVIEVFGADEELHEHRDNLLKYIDHNAYRTDYREYRRRNLQIGSGAMEGLHRTQQCRVKMPGPGWLPEHAEAIFNLRMLRLAGRWDNFWAQPGLFYSVAEALTKARRLAA